MRFDFTSDCDSLVLFDPAALPADFNRLDCAVVETELEKGNFLELAGDGDLKFCVFIDEKPDERLILRSRIEVEGALLRVPCGKLVVDAADSLPPFDGPSPEGTAVPSGNYLVNALKPDWSKVEIEKDRKSMLGTIGYYFDWLFVAPMGCLVVTVPVILVILVNAACRSSWAVFWNVTLYGGLPVFAVFIVVWLFDINSSIGKHKIKVAEALRSKYPDIILVLTRLPDDADLSSLNGCALGI